MEFLSSKCPPYQLRTNSVPTPYQLRSEKELKKAENAPKINTYRI